MQGLASTAYPCPMIEFWETWRPASCLPAACFCEQIGIGLLRQPINAISSLGFVVAGVGIGLGNRSDVSVTSPVRAATYGLALVAIGLGSAMFHASLSFVGQTADLLGMYFLATFAVLEPIRRRGYLSERGWLATYLAANGVLFGLLVAVPAARRYLFALLLLVAIALELRLRGPSPVSRQLGWALALLAVATGIWALDITKTWCDPTSLLQGHAVWHLLGATSAALLFRHYQYVAASARQD